MDDKNVLSHKAILVKYQCKNCKNHFEGIVKKCEHIQISCSFCGSEIIEIYG